ncbi:MAG: hypothetical protein H0W08_23435 [Acidobacteria bacterium]|nr:hypothetical protein [Acidobacteriota bacterium]
MTLRARAGADTGRAGRPGSASAAREARGQWLVLCHTTDLPALWAYRGLRARGLAPIEVVSAETLSAALRWVHRVGAAGADVEIALTDGRAIRAARIRGVVNRIVSVPVTIWRGAPEADRDYVLQELTALYASWLYALPCPVLNRPTAFGLAGAWRHESEWVRLAAWAGLPTPTYRHSCDDGFDDAAGERRLLPAGTHARTVIVAGGRAFAAHAPGDVMNGCVRLAKLSNTPLLGVEFVAGAAGAWTFAGATPTPDLIQGGPPMLDALAEALRTSAHGSA